MNNNPDQRRRDLSRIHCLKKELGLDDENYRNVLYAVTRQESAAVLDAAQRKSVIDHMQSHIDARDRKFRHPNDAGAEARALNATPDKQAMLMEIARLLPAIGKDSFYCDGISRNMFNVQRYEWCQPAQLHKIIAALNYARIRAQRVATVNG